jgi:hypothetical protein
MRPLSSHSLLRAIRPIPNLSVTSAMQIGNTSAIHSLFLGKAVNTFLDGSDAFIFFLAPVLLLLNQARDLWLSRQGRELISTCLASW